MNVSKLLVELSFPQGAHFYQNINIIVYKQLMKFIHSLNCLSSATKCYECPLSSQCRYYHCTGQNFLYYPGILMHNETFMKSIYRNEENIVFEFYLIGDIKQYMDYIVLFFESYLHQSLCQSIFYIKNIQQEIVNDEEITIDTINLHTIIEDENIINVYHDMIHYYNEHYHTFFNDINTTYTISKKRNILLNDIQLQTKRIHQRGIIAQYHFDQPIVINKCFLDIGIGKYNFIGGGYFET